MICICPNTLIQFKLDSYRTESTILYRHPDSYSLSAIQNNKSKIIQLYGVLVWFKVIDPITDLSQQPFMSKWVAGMNLKNYSTEQLIKQLSIRKNIRIARDTTSKVATQILIGIFEGNLGDKVIIGNNATDSHDKLIKERNQKLRCLMKLLDDSKMRYLAYPKDRQEAYQFSQAINAKSDLAIKVKALLADLANNKAFVSNPFTGNVLNFNLGD